MSETEKDGNITIAVVPQSEAATNILKSASSTETVTVAGKKGRKTVEEKEGILVKMEKEDIPAPLDGILRNTPEVRDVLRSVREEIRDFFRKSYRELKSKKILRLQELDAKEPRTSDENQEMETLKKEIEVTGEIYADFQPIGKGGFGEVYRAKDTVLGEKVVLKVVNNLSPEGRERLLREAKTLVDLEHDGILKGYLLRKLGPKGIQGLPGSENKYVIETESIQGENLEKISEKLLQDLAEVQKQLNDGKVTWDHLQKLLGTWDSLGVETSAFYGIRFTDAGGSALELSAGHAFSGQDGKKALETLQEMKNEFVIGVIAQACRGLEHAHQAGILHRDIKPANLMVTKEGKTKIIDWGLVKALEQEEVAKSKEPSTEASPFSTAAGEVIGTPLYMAPEQATGKGASIRSDVWEMGVTLVQSLTGVFPVDADGVVQVLTKVANNELNWEAIQKEIESPLLYSIIQKALAFAPRDRFQTMKDFQEALELYNALKNSNSFDMYLQRKVAEEKRKTFQFDVDVTTEEEEIRILKEDLLGEGRSWGIQKALLQFQKILEFEGQFA